MTYETRIAQTVPDDVVSQLWASASDREAFLRVLREQGASKIESIRSLKRVEHIGLGEAKEIVHFSPVWADRRAADEAFHDHVAQLLQELEPIAHGRLAS